MASTGRLQAAFAFLLAVTSTIALETHVPCSGLHRLAHSFHNEHGNFVLEWDIDTTPGVAEMQITLPGSAFIAFGLGSGSMFDTDMHIGWVMEDGTAVMKDYWSKKHEKPNDDVSLGGTEDVKLLCGERVNSYTTLRWQRKFNTSDKYDEVITREVNNIVYAWQDGTPGDIKYHGNKHNYVMVNFSSPSGYPDNAFGRDESGLSARQLVNLATYGALTTLLTKDTEGGMPMTSFPFSGVASYADESPSSGRPILLLTDVERNVLDWKADPRCSFHIQQPVHAGSEVVEDARVTLMGTMYVVPAADIPAARKQYLVLHPDAEEWIDFSNFRLYFFNVSDVYWVGGFGDTHYLGWVSAADYFSHKL